MNTTSRKPESVSSVNITPLEPTSLRTMYWTPAESATSECSKPWWTRYEIARSLNSDANTSCTAFTTASLPRTLSSVSCCPANDASGRSSAVADERTATATSARPSHILS